MLMESFRGESAKWMTPREDGHSTLATTLSLTASHHISASRIKNMSMFGSVIGLNLIRGTSVSPMDPSVIYFFMHNCDIHSLHLQLIGEWHPGLKKKIEDWKRVGPDGDIGGFQDFFATYHDLQVSTYVSHP